MNINAEICNAFSAHAKEYEQAAKIQHEIGTRLFERLSYLKIDPRYILDLGCGTGVFSQQLKRRYPKAQIVSIDLAYNMLTEVKAKQGWRKKWPLVNGHMEALPFDSGVFDLVFSNQVVHWASSLSNVMSELNRVMNTDGCLMFSTMGPDTLKELRKAWSEVDEHSHANEFIDMHDIGDSLLQAKFLDPVVDMENLTVHFKSLPHLLRSLKSQGVRNISSSRRKGLTGKAAWSQFESAYARFTTEKGLFPLSYEVVYGHAWKGQQSRTQTSSETMISVEQLRKTLSS